MSLIDKVITDDIEMAYCRFGNGKRTLVILPGLSLQGVLSAAAAIEKHYEIFKKDFTVYLFERRSNLPPVYTIDNMAADTAKALTALGLQHCCVFGTSQGGMIAMVLAARYPALVGKLALGSTAARIGNDNAAVLTEWVTLAENKDAESLYLSFGKNVYPPATFRQYEAFFRKIAKTVTDEELERFAILAGSTDRFDFTAELAQIRCPVLAVGDTDDRVLGKDATPEIAALLKDKPNFSCYMYEGYGHAAYDTAPDYTQRLYNFFQ